MAAIGNFGREHTLESAGVLYSPLIPSANPWAYQRQTNLRSDVASSLPAGPVAIQGLSDQSTAANEVVTGAAQVPEPLEKSEQKKQEAAQIWPLLAAVAIFGVAFFYK